MNTDRKRELYMNIDRKWELYINTDRKRELYIDTDRKRELHMDTDRKRELHMNTDRKQRIRKNLANYILFLAIMALTFYTVLRGQDWNQIGEALRRLSLPCMLMIFAAALFFVCAEGCMIWYLLRAINPGSSGPLKCISYSFIGFFYSGITPSSTGGQPVQLYYMKKDGNSLSDSTVVLMIVALLYKFVLVIIGCAMLVFWFHPLKTYLREYFGLYILGLVLHVILVAVLLAVMFVPAGMKKLIFQAEHILIRIKIFKASEQRAEKIHQFIDSYQDAVRFLAKQKYKMLLILVFTFFQRCSLFFLTGLVYRGFAQQGTSFLTVMLLQASVSVAADMLPLPGAQGITELMYCKVFRNVFTENYLMPSLYVARGSSFYFLLAVSLLVVGINEIWRRKAERRGAQ